MKRLFIIIFFTSLVAGKMYPEYPTHLLISPALPEEYESPDEYYQSLILTGELKDIDRIIPQNDSLIIKKKISDGYVSSEKIPSGARLILRFDGKPKEDINVSVSSFGHADDTYLYIDNDFLCLNTSNPDKFRISIFSEDGRLVREGAFDISGYFSLTPLSKGIYVGLASSSKEQYTLTFIIH